MIFKDQAQQMVSRWECLRNEDDVKLVAAQTAVSLSALPEVPLNVLKALDGLLDYDGEKRGRRIYEVTRYLRSLTEDCLRMEAERK